MMRLWLLLLPCILYGQAVFDDFSQGIRTYEGRPMYEAIRNELLVSFPFNTISAGTHPYRLHESNLNTASALTITAADGTGISGSARLKVTPFHDFVQWDSLRITNLTCTGPSAPNCVTWGGVVPFFGRVVDLPQWTSDASGMTGTNTFHTSTPHTMQTGEYVSIQNCAIENATINGIIFQIGAVTSTTMDLVGFSPTYALCGYESYVVDHVHLDLGYTGTWIGGSTWAGTGTVKQIASGWRFQTIFEQNGGTYPNVYIAGNLISGNWCPGASCSYGAGADIDYNRLRFEIKCDWSLLLGSPTGPAGWQFSSYPTPPNNPGNVVGYHFYDIFNGDQHANHTRHFEVNRVPVNTTATAGARNRFRWMDDPFFWMRVSSDYQFHYFDGMGIFYVDTPTPFDFQMENGGSCDISNFRFDRVVNESETYTHTVSADYDGTQYQMTWSGQDTPSGVLYDIRYSTANSCHTLGWSNCTTPSGGTGPTIAGGAGTGYYVTWKSPPMAEQPNMWIAVKPHYPIGSVTGSGTSPAILTPLTGHDMQTGDTVTISGVTNVTDGAYTITRINPLHWGMRTGTATGVVVSGGVATATVNNTAGLKVGMTVYALAWGNNQVFDDREAIITALTSTTIQWSTTAGDFTYNPTTSPTGTITSIPAMSLNGTTGSGTAGASNGTVTPISETTGFYEMRIPADPIGGGISFKGSIGGKVTIQ